MREIKFRGLAVSQIDGKKNFKPRMVYGSVRTTENGDYACIATFKNERGATFSYNVKPESVAMFCGYDQNGEEIYSDDKIRVYEYGVEPKIWDAGDFFNVSEIGEEFDFIELLNS